MKAFLLTVTRRPIGVTIIALAVALLGFVSVRELAIDLLPDVDMPWVSVTTQYEGVAPEEIETLITRPIEQATSTVQGVTRIESTSAEGMSRVRLQFTWGSDVDQSLDDVRVAVDRARRILPEGADPPSVFKFDLSSMPVVHLGVTGDSDTRRLKHLAEDDLSRALERLPGVASVDARGGRDREIRVELEGSKLSALGVSAPQVSAALARENRTVSAGDMLDRGRQVVIRTAGEYEALSDIENTVVTTKNGTPIRVRDLGTVEDSIRRVRSELWIDKVPGIELRVFKQSGANTVTVARAVEDEIARLNAEYQGRAALSVLWNAADYIRSAVRGVAMSAVTGAALAVLVLLLFLRSFRATLVVGTAIPLSILATFTLVYSQGMTLNLISFGGLALGVGMLVDGAIVILESIYKRRADGLEAGAAAVEGAAEVSGPVISGTLTTIVVFAPVVFVGGIAGVLFAEMAAVVTFALLCSLVVALLLVPMLAGKLLGFRNEAAPRPEVREAPSLLGRLEGFYGRLLDAALDAPWAVIVGSLALLGSSLLLLSRVGVELMPESDEARFEVDLEFPVGTPLDVTSELVLDAERRVLGVVGPAELSHVITSAGPEAWWRPGGSNEGEVEVALVPVSERSRTVEELLPQVNDALRDLPGAKIRVSPTSANVLGRIIRRGDDRLSVEIRGHDLEAADTLAEAVVAAMRDVPGVTYARPDRELGQLERIVDVDRQRSAELGLGSADVAATVEHYVLGRVATRYRDRGDEYDVRVQLRESDRERISQLPELPILTGRGDPVPLHSMGTLRERAGPSSISRVDQERMVRVNAGKSDRPLGEIAADIERRLAQVAVPAGFSVALGGELAEQQETFMNLLVGILLALFLVYATMAVQFESVRQPLAIMASVPFAFIGVILALVVTNTTFNMNSFLGTIVLVGIVVNNAIVLVDYANLLRRRDGLGVREALVVAGQRRLRPILMTTLTTLLGLMPLATGFSEGAEMQVPLARAIIGGLTTSSLVTLLLVPALYYLIEHRRAARPAEAHALVRGVPHAAE